MAFDKNTLQEIRDRVKVSEVVGRKFQLRKQGSEMVVVDNPSFTVNDAKGIWKDFGNGGSDKAGDVFSFLVEHEGFSFVEAVKELAGIAGVRIPQGETGQAARTDRGQASKTSVSSGRADQVDGARRSGMAGAGSSGGKNEIVATWDVIDSEGGLLYQVVRRQKRLPDGSWELNKEGKVWKTFSQRRPSPDDDGSWVWKLDLKDEHGKPHEFMRYRGDWITYSEKNFVEWKLTERRSFPDATNVEHWLYNANEVIDELREDRDDQRTIFMPEGEAKVDVLREWGLLALCNTGGAKNFTADHAEFFRGAKDVVVLLDNDRAGLERMAKIGPMLAAVGAGVRALNFRDVWRECPGKGDVKDWRDQGGGTRDKLLEIIDGLKPWAPEPYKSRFGAKMGRDLGAPAKAYPWRIKNIVPMSDNLLIMGASRSGKTFEALDMVMHVHFGEMFAGRKVIPGGILYLTYEGATGFENRLRAYLLHHGYKAEDLHSFAWLTRPPNIFASEDNVEALVQEIIAIAATFKLPLAAIVIDTHNSATRGSSEIKSDDLNKIMERYSVIAERTGAPLWIIGHTNAEGKHRGNEQFFNNIETALLVERVMDEKGKSEKRDDEGRVLRRVRVNKQREGDDRLSWEFVLQNVKIGVDEDGDDITSMASIEPAQSVPDNVGRMTSTERPEGFYLKGNNVDVFRALLRAVDDHGVAPPPQLELPASVSRVVSWGMLGVVYKKTDPQERDESNEKYSNRIKARTRRFREELLKYNVIGIGEMVDPDNPEKTRHYVWPTGRRVFGKGIQWPNVPKKKPDAAVLIDEATGEPLTGLDGDMPSTVF